MTTAQLLTLSHPCLGRCGVTYRLAMPTESQLSDTALRTFIAQRLDEGRLPLVLTKTIGVGFGSGAECLACGQTITTEQIEYQAFGPKYGAALRLHWGCHVLWQLECVKRTRPHS